MNQNFTVRKLARCAVVAALYVVLCMALQPFSYGAVQVRVAEALCLLPVFGACLLYTSTSRPGAKQIPSAAVQCETGCFLFLNKERLE